jgi:spore coat polysaccharide biosynthesis protein SpsF
MSYGILITARTASTRLPGKMLQDLNGKPVIYHAIDNAKQVESVRPQDIVLCTTLRSEDNILQELAIERGISCFRGSTGDKIERWLGAMWSHDLRTVVTFDGDDPLCSAELADMAFVQWRNNGCDFIEAPDEIPIGSFTYLFSRETLWKIYDSKESGDTEMMMEYFHNFGCKKEKLNTSKLPSCIFKSHRLTLDYAEDLVFFRTIFRVLRDEYRILNPTLWEVLLLLEARPEICDINAFRHEEWKANQIRKSEHIREEFNVK